MTNVRMNLEAMGIYHPSKFQKTDKLVELGTILAIAAVFIISVTLK